MSEWRGERHRTARIAVLLLAGAFGGCVTGAELALPGPASADAADGGGATFAGRRLGERRATTIDALAADPRHGAPRCTSARLAPVDGARRAFPLERCEHPSVAGEAGNGSDGGGVALLEHPLTTLVTYFVDGRLARLDARLAPTDAEGTVGTSDGASNRREADDGHDGGSGAGARGAAYGSAAALVARLDERLGARLDHDGEADEGTTVIRWALGADIVELAIGRELDRTNAVDGATDGSLRLAVFDGRVLAVLPGLGEDDPTVPDDE